MALQNSHSTLLVAILGAQFSLLRTVAAQQLDEWGHTLLPADGVEEGLHMSCTSSQPGALSINITDGQNVRCFLAIPPTEEVTEPLPLLFIMHGANGVATDCGENEDNLGNSWITMQKEYGFWLICPEAQIYEHPLNEVMFEYAGLWNFPEVQTDETGPKCDPEQSLDNQYFINLIEELDQHPNMFDTSRIFTHGCSSGSGVSLWQGTCFHERYPDRQIAMAPHSTGLKIKGDGTTMGCAIFEDNWGDCEMCQYWPVAPIEAPSLKACIFDGTADPSESDPYFYRTSLALADAWGGLGNPYEEHYGTGGHCDIISMPDIIRCLDDGKGRLNSSATTSSSTTTTTTITNRLITTTVTTAKITTTTTTMTSATTSETVINTTKNTDEIVSATMSSQFPQGSEDYGDCVDESPSASYNCEEWVSSTDLDMCSTAFMQGFCCKTCHQCHPLCGTGETSTNVPTTTTTTTTTTAAKIPETTTPRKSQWGKESEIIIKPDVEDEPKLGPKPVELPLRNLRADEAGY